MPRSATGDVDSAPNGARGNGITFGAPPETLLIPLTDLHPAPWNPRLIKDERFKNLVRSIQADPDFLWRRPILANLNGEIMAGNMRYRAAEHLKMASVPAILDDVPDQLAKERALRDNAQWGEWQEEELAQLIYELSEAGSAIDLLGFDEKELGELMASVSGEEEEPATPLMSAEWLVVVECASEQQQAELLERFQEEGLSVRAVMA